MILAQGDRRGLVVVDHAGGLHALGKRILDVNKAALLDRLADLDLNELPTVQQAQSIIREMKAELQPEAQPQEKKAPNWNRDRANQTWEDAVINAAIEQEKTARQFVEPKPEKETRGGRLKKEQPPPAKGPAADIWNAMQRSDSPRAFAVALREKGMDLAAVTEEEASRSRIAAAYPKAIGGLFLPEYRAGEIVAVTERGQVYQLNRRTTGKEREQIEAFFAPLDRSQVQGIEATRQSQQQRRGERHWPTMPPQPEPVKTSPGLHFQDAAREATDPDPTPEKQPFGIAARIKNTHAAGQGGELKFAAALEEQGIEFAAVTQEEADKSHREAEFAKAIDRRAPAFRAGEIVAVTMPRLEYHQAGEWSELPRVHKLDQKEASKYLKALSLDAKQLQGIDATKQKLDTKAQQRKAERESDRMDRATWMEDWAPERGKKNRNLPRILEGLGKTAANIIEAGFDGPVNLTTAALSFFDPPTTPAQREQAAENSRDEREAQAERSIDFSKYTSDRAQERQNDQEQQAARDRQRELERDR